MEGGNFNRNSRPDRRSVILLLVCLQLFAGAYASRVYAEDSRLQAEPPVLDQSPVQALVLQGWVGRHDATLSGETAEQTTQLNADVESKNDNNLNAPSGARSDSPQFDLRARTMTAEDFRNLNYGVIGMNSERSIFGGKQTVIEVYPDCPAALAGIQPGDVEVQANDHVWGEYENQRSTWNIADGKAGTPVDLTIRRRGQLMTFHLVRMNIEDIQNDRVRRMFEKLLRKLGPPSR